MRHLERDPTGPVATVPALSPVRRNGAGRPGIRVIGGSDRFPARGASFSLTEPGLHGPHAAGLPYPVSGNPCRNTDRNSTRSRLRQAFPGRAGIASKGAVTRLPRSRPSHGRNTPMCADRVTITAIPEVIG
nr:hypothetical protein KitaXyl93_32380 [Kitasatospora sp. Xyl93]